MSEKPLGYPCRKCLIGRVLPTGKDGRFYEFKGVWINLPIAFQLDVCTNCKQVWMDDDDERRMDIVLQGLYVEHADLIDLVFQDHDLKLRARHAAAQAAKK